ncbi:MAG: Do family serine endopeptidase [Chitinophagales bacterium]|nr:Do family serine endopeptidase [Chitinophagales bacterium]MDW8420056.1 Do family serine endopeptidase [Chitinophagales bacterium]
MNRLFVTALVAFISAFAAVGLYNYMGWNKPQVIINDTTPAKLASYAPARTEVQPIDFRYAASVATPTVVHIKSTYKAEKPTTFRDPFRDLFGDDFFHFFHGPNPYNRQPQVSTGSGVIVSEDGYIVTNNHVVNEANEIEVILHNNKTYKAKLIGKDPDTDLALIKIEASDLPAISFGNSDSALVGEWVLAVGNPFNLSSTVTAGIISAKGRNINILNNGSGKTSSAIESFIQTDAAVNPGNSGGALVNVNGQLIGINTAIASPTGSYAGYSFAVPSNIVKKVIFDLKTYGVTQRGFLGVTIRSMDDATAKELGFDRPYGVYVESVNSGSAAEDAGIKKKDVITHINGVPVNSSPELQEQVAKYRPGDKINVDYIRDGKKMTATVTLKNKYNTTSAVDNKTDILDLLGIKVSNLSDQEKRSLGITGGVRIDEIKPGKISEYTDIRKGFIILQVDDEQVQNVQDLVNILQNKTGRVVLEGIYPNKAVSYLYAFRM